MATSKTRLVMTLAGAGVPVDRVTLTGPDSAEVTYMPGATPEQVAAGAAALAAFDWSDAAESAWLEGLRRADAKAILTAGDPMPTATRAGCLALMLSLQECRAKVNELIAAAKAGDVSGVEPLVTGDSFAAALEQVAQLIDAGVA